MSVGRRVGGGGVGGGWGGGGAAVAARGRGRWKEPEDQYVLQNGSPNVTNVYAYVEAAYR